MVTLKSLNDFYSSMLNEILYFNAVKRFGLIILQAILIVVNTNAQIGGQNIYRFINLPNSSRILSIGGDNVSFRDDDPAMAYLNPALLNPLMNKSLLMSFSDYFAGINYGYASYAMNAGSIATLHAGVQYVNYGTFDQADNTGEITGEFTAGEYCFTAGAGKSIDSLFSIGVNLKAISSRLEQYSSFGMALDAGFSYLSKSKLFEAGLVLRNLGYQFSTYTTGNHEKLPLELTAGISGKLKHVPLRLSLTAHNLQQPDLSYRDPSVPEETIDPLSGDTTINKISLPNKIMRHAIVAAELSIIKGFTLRIGYNYQRRQEMKIASRIGTVGISWGVSAKIYKFSLSYGRSAYHLAGSPNQITVSARLSEFYTRK
jgi:hypothetical protein